jgi:methylmalonyl-CoA mutase C-terminal domain/subunit
METTCFSVRRSKIITNTRSTTKVILATLGLETHWRGVITVACMLRNQGMEVVYLGNAYPEEIITAAIQEDVSVVGISVLSGAHLTLGSRLLEIAKQKNIKGRMLFLIGGVFPPSDIPKLIKLGFDGVFGPGTRGEEIGNFIARTKTVPQEKRKKESTFVPR